MRLDQVGGVSTTARYGAAQKDCHTVPPFHTMLSLFYPSFVQAVHQPPIVTPATFCFLPE
jgi:hypothetical protein